MAQANFYWTARVSGVTLSRLEEISNWNLVYSLAWERNNNQKTMTNVYLTSVHNISGTVWSILDSVTPQNNPMRMAFTLRSILHIRIWPGNRAKWKKEDSKWQCGKWAYLVVVQSLGRVWLFANPWTTAHQASLSFTFSWSLLKLMPIESVMPSNHLALSHPFHLLPSILLSTTVFSNESALRNRWPKYWSCSSVLPVARKGDQTPSS